MRKLILVFIILLILGAIWLTRKTPPLPIQPEPPVKIDYQPAPLNNYQGGGKG